MIEHLRGRERKLEPLGWTGREAEWIALVCLHSGVFTRPQFCRYFGDAHRWKAGRFVQSLLDRKAAIESASPVINGRGKTCRISGKPIYRALGVENIRHRRPARPPVMMRRLLSLDFVLEHPGMNWLPAEPEKVEFFEGLGLSRRLIPRRIYYGAVGAQKRYFALKLPIAAGPETVTFAYVDPGHQTDRELHSWGAAHGPLWDALRKKGRQVRVIGIAAENETVDRTARVLRVWAAAAPKETGEGPMVKQEIKAIGEAMTHNDEAGRQLQYKRVNGPYTLIMTAVGQTGLPFGNLSRLLLAWVCTEAVRTQSRELVLGASLSGFMRKLGMAPIGGGSRGERTRLRNQMKRLFNAHIQLAYEDERASASVNSPVASRTGFWWNPKRPHEQSLWDSHIELGEKFFEEIIQHPVPLELNILKALTRSSLGLDFYLWLTYRTFTLKGPLRLSWVCLYRQFGVKPVKAGDNRTVDNFRTDCLRELKKIKIAWPDLNYAMVKGALVLLPSKPNIPPHVVVSARGTALKSPLLAQNRSLAVPGGSPLLGIQGGSFLGHLRAFSTKPL